MSALLDILSFQNSSYINFILVTALMSGLACGLIGAFLVLRGRTLISDASAHAALPGLGIGFFVAFALGLEGGRHLPTLLFFAFLSAGLGALCVQWIVKNTRLRQDVAIASVLSVFYGLGIVFLSVIQRFEGAAQAGLESFLLGQLSGLTQMEAFWIIGLSLFIIALSLYLAREFLSLCFDQNFMASAGRPIHRLDLILGALMLIMICAGLKTMGAILIVALLIIPSAIAKNISQNGYHFIGWASLFGGLSAYIGAGLSALYDDLPTSAGIVLCAAGFFVLSLIKSSCPKGIANAQ